jgi:predicted Zn-dependent protease
MKIATYTMLLAGTIAITGKSLTAEAPTQANGPVKVWQGMLTLPTYEEGEPDPNPPFDIYATTEFNYPYTLRTDLTGVKHEHDWRAIFLENEYLKCTILPDIGGHLYTCVDKISGQPMFYANPSIKEAEIGHRGAWAAFGVEYNFPVSHNWVSMSPVDFAYTTNPDGSASVTIGNIDRPYGMQWGVELSLKPHSTLLEERVTLYNRSDVRHRFYWWDNAGVQVWDDTRIEYPMRFAASHGFTDVYQWPILGPGGKDLSLLKNHTNGPVSYFSHGSQETFMGVWNPKTNAGVAQFSEYRDLPAKKIWSWGSDADGLAWRTALSDNQSTYVEVQAGLFRNQETYAFLDPGQTIRFNEYWMPVRGTGGISRANKAGVVKLETHGSEISATLDVNEPLPRAQLSLIQNGVTLWSGTTDLLPEKTWSHLVSVKDQSAKVTFELKDRDGRSILKQTDGKYDWDPETSIKIGPQQAYPMPGVAARSEDDWLLLGTDQEVNGQVVLAMTTYQKALEKYPESLSLQVAMGRLAASLQRYSEAVPLLQAAQTRDTPNSVVAYYLGIAEEGLGHPREAETSFDIAYRQALLRAPAARSLGELEAQQGHLPEAYIYLKAAVDAAPLDLLAQEEKEALTRALGNTDEADRLAHLGLAANPVSDFLKEDTATPDLQHLAADPYRVLRVAAEYMQLGLYQKALTVLDRTYSAVPADQSEPGSVLPQNHPLVLYYAAYCKSKLGDGAQQNWQAASRLSPSLVFPSTQVDRFVLEDALHANEKDATAHYLLGTLQFSEGLFDAGIAHWTEAKRLNPHLPVVDADLGKAWLRLKGDTQRALASFVEGTRNDPENEEVYVGVDQAMSLTGVSAAKRADALSRYPNAEAPQSKMPAKLVYQLALTRAEAGQYERALSLFKDRFFPREEGGITSSQVVFEIKLMQSEADSKAGECPRAEGFLASDLAKSGSRNSSQAYFRMAQVARACKQLQESEGLLKEAAANKNPTNLPWAIKAEQALGTYNAGNTEKALRKAIPEHLTEISDYSGSRWYNIGMTQAALHQDVDAKKSFRNSLLLPDSFMSHHLSRVASSSLYPTPAATMGSTCAARCAGR